MTIQLKDTLQRNLNIPSTIIDDDIVVMSIENSEYYAMDAAAAKMWAWLEQPITVSGLFQRIETEYQIKDQSYQQETCTFLASALEKNLIHFLDTSHAPDTDTNTLSQLLEKSIWQSVPSLRTFAMNTFTQAGPGVGPDLGAQLGS